jgi:cytochrome c553
VNPTSKNGVREASGGTGEFMKKLLMAFGAGCLLASSVAANAADAANGKALADSHNCAACHGPGLTHPVSPDYPRLAGQYPDYLYWAMRSYQVGNSNPRFGRANAIMSAQLQNLSESDLSDLAAYISSLPGDLVLKK